MRCQITSASSTLQDHFGAHFSSIVGLADQRHKVNERFARVEPLGAVLGGRIVVRERVMIVVKALADGAQANKQVFGRVDCLVVWLVAEHVCEAVYEPGEVKQYDVAQDSWHEIGDRQRFRPEEPWDHSGHDEANKNCKYAIVSFFFF